MNNKKKEAMSWWKNLASLQKTQICDTNTELVGSVRRWESLTSSEILKLYEEECNADSEIIDYTFKNRGTQRSPFGIGS